ncbi:breast cancer anti-estrogen resistance protein 3-like [Scleropages formosus]|uniref:breast cancer anti-estrogen resistance protein 3-like n=1 Tax=Scleropages formosus TaxID=113540 RepID=UPI0010FA8F81|nr:breast cancer anti-estrogen resistance protein 3-like [Scleropages formosus]
MRCLFWDSEFIGKMSERCSVLQNITSALCCFYHKPSVIKAQFTQESASLESSAEKLHKELVVELKWSSEEPHNHSWYHGALPLQVGEHPITRDGNLPNCDPLSSPGSYTLTCQWKDTPQHFKITKGVAMASEAYKQAQYLLEGEACKSMPALVCHYVGNCKPLSEQVGPIISQPVNRGLPLRCLEEIYGSQAVLLMHRAEPCRCLCVSILNENNQGRPCYHGNLLRTEERCLSQPMCANRRQTFTSCQSESILHHGLNTKCMETLLGTRPLLFRMGNEPPLSPPMSRMAYKGLTEVSFMMSGNHLCSDLPTKPRKASSGKLAHVLHTQLLDPSFQSAQQLKHCYSDLNFGEWRTFGLALKDRLFTPLSNTGFMERLKTDEDEYSCQRKPEACLTKLNQNLHCLDLDVLDVHGKKKGHMLLQGMSEEGKMNKLHQKEQKKKWFQPPMFQKTSAFSPREFRSRLLPFENKPLEMSLLKKINKLLDRQNHRTIAKHILQADCKVARILHIAEEVKGEMGVNSGLELVTLPHGKQLRQDLMERHSTMAFWVAVTILACTGHPEERAAALNRFLLIARELKDSMGDLFAFSAILKALEMLQIRRLEHSWTSLRRKHPQTAVMYDKCLKPFFKGLYEGSIAVPPDSTTVPLLMPLLTLMEGPPVATDDGDIWESDDLGCDTTLQHLEMARVMAWNAEACATNAECILQEFQPDEDLVQIFTTDFQLRLLWGSRGALLNQKERFEKFSLILTALSRKLEPSVK